MNYTSVLPVVKYQGDCIKPQIHHLY